MPTVVHFEIPADDTKRAQKFYSDLFDWKFSRMPGEFEYWGIETEASGDRPALGGGLTKRQHPQQAPINYVGVESVDETVSRAKALGASVVLEKQEVPKYGFMALLTDTEGNVFGLWQPTNMPCDSQG